MLDFFFLSDEVIESEDSDELVRAGSLSFNQLVVMLPISRKLKDLGYVFDYYEDFRYYFNDVVKIAPLISNEMKGVDSRTTFYRGCEKFLEMLNKASAINMGLIAYCD